MREQNSQFKKDVLKAKAKYRKRRKFIILAIMTFALAVTLLQTFLYIRDKKQINAQLAEQNKMIENLDKENKVNELVIDKLKAADEAGQIKPVTSKITANATKHSESVPDPMHTRRSKSYCK